MKKNILFITANTHVPWGGSEELWSKTAKRLAETGNYQIFAHAGDWKPMPAHIQAIEAAGGQFVPFPDPISSILGRIKRYIHVRINPAIHKQFNGQRKLLEQFKPDFVVLSLGSQLQGESWMAKFDEQKIPYITIVQLASELQWVGDDLLKRLAKGYQNAKHNFFVSQHNLALTARQMLIPMDNASVVRNPFKVRGKTIPYPNTSDGFVLACPASYVAFHKGQDILLELFSQQKWRDRPIKLHLYGKGMHENYFKRFIDFKALKNVAVKGFVTDIDHVWQQSHAMILSSRMEGLPLALVEAMLCGRTAIVADTAGNAECIQDNINGFVAKAPTIELMDIALERAWNRRAEWEHLGQLAAEHARTIIPSDPVGIFAEQLQKFF